MYIQHVGKPTVGSQIQGKQEMKPECFARIATSRREKHRRPRDAIDVNDTHCFQAIKFLRIRVLRRDTIL